jgi:hypothetical protein
MVNRMELGLGLGLDIDSVSVGKVVGNKTHGRPWPCQREGPARA